jgi:site-specific DNA recombinase
MTHSYTQKGNRRYRYYVCTKAQKRGWTNCPAPSLAAGDVERFVVDVTKSIGHDPAVVAETVRQVAAQTEHGIKRLAAEHDALRCQLVADNAELGRIAGRGDTERLADLQDRLGKSERRISEIDSELSITFRPTGLKSLGEQLAQHEEVAA